MQESKVSVTRVESFKRKGPPFKYPLDDWFAKIITLGENDALVLKQGKHFTCEPKQMRNYLHRQSPRFGIRLRTIVEESSLKVGYGGHRETQTESPKTRTKSRKRQSN